MDKCVLLHVEDEDSAGSLFRSVLDEAQIEANVFRVSSSEAALKFLRKASPYERARRPRLIVLDLGLPQGDGWSFLAQVKSDPDLLSIPVVVLSIESAPEHAARALAAGAQAYIEKPYDFDVFVKQVKEAYGFALEGYSRSTKTRAGRTPRKQAE
jgi:two-component system, chemotaxis family, response regulator Rcp1